jgi:outer membrane immunogenic protein
LERLSLILSGQGDEMKMCRWSGRVIALAFVAILSNTIGFSALAADLSPIVQGGGYYNWTGFYAGGNLGAGVGRMEFTATMPGLTASTSDEIRGFVGGVQGGFNWQNGPLVAGIEADVQFSHQRNGVNTTELQITNSMDFFGTLRGRVGYAMDEWLFYLTAGGGYGSTQASMITTCVPPPVPPPGPVCASTLPAAGSFSGSDFSPFWVVGVGVETQIWDRWTGRIEYLYLQSGSISNPFAVSGGTLAVTKSVYDNVIRTGLNYHF